MSLDSLRAAAEAAEDRVATLTSELEHSRSRILTIERESESRDQVARTCFEEADAEINRLRSELDSTLNGLRDAHERAAAASTVIDDERETPRDDVDSDSATVFSEVDASILVLRLREERDELRTRLDFAQREAHFKGEAQLKQLRQAEEAKEQEAARAHDEILRLTAQLASETDSLETARDNVAQLQDRLNSASEEVQRLQEISRAPDTTSSSQSELESKLQAQVEELQAR
jgi:chromosome segregation ATPase